MATNFSVCGVCNFRQLTTPSVVWCSECDEGLCSNCKEHHAASRGTRDHNTIPINEYNKLPANVLEITQFCSKHDEKVQLFCKKHDTPCCRRCMLESHSKCEGIAAIDDVIHNVKLSSNFTELEQSIIELKDNLEKIRKNEQKNLASLKEERNQIEKKIEETRKNINQHLDKIEKELIKELCSAEATESNKISAMLAKLDQNEADLNELHNILCNVKQHASDLQTFLAMKYLETAANEKEEVLQSLVGSDTMKQTSLSCTINQTLQTLSAAVHRFGEITVEKKSSEVVVVRRKDRQAQIMVPLIQPRSVDQISLQLIKSLNIKSRSIRGCTTLPDDKKVFSDYYFSQGKIVIMNNDGTEEFIVKVPNTTFDVVFIREDNVVAVSSGWQFKINFIDMKSKKVKKAIDVGSLNFGMVVQDQSLIFCAVDKGIRRLNLKDESVSDIIKIQLPHYSYITQYRNTIFFTNPGKDTVTCCDLHGTIKWEFKNENLLKCPYGISVDNDGNLYVVGHKSENVVVISPDGQKQKQILSKKDGLINPQVLHYDRSTNYLLVANNQHNAFLFSVKTNI